MTWSPPAIAREDTHVARREAIQAAAPVLVAADKFKGSFSATEVAATIAAGLRAGGRDAEQLPIADGGEGTLEALLLACGGERLTRIVSDPLGRQVEAQLGLLDDGDTAVVEAAAASGLTRLRADAASADERDPWAASTRGTGELIAAAVAAGARAILVGCGGSATVDGGAGALEAVGELPPGVRIKAICDVRTPWEQAAAVFGPQKGADEATVRRLERRLDRQAEKLRRDPRGIASTGCGGGLSGALWSELGAELVPGPAYVLDALGFDERMRRAAFVVTGEGCLDGQTLAGKAVAEVATRCRQSGVWCHAVVGRDELDLFGKRVLDLASVREARDLDALRNAGRVLA